MWAHQKLILGTMSDTPRCPKCNEPPAHTSEMQWCMGWWPFTDENGVEHSHDPNRRTPYYRCANGHHWGDETKWYFKPCPACGKTVDDIDNEKRAAQGLGPIERSDHGHVVWRCEVCNDVAHLWGRGFGTRCNKHKPVGDHAPGGSGKP